MVWRRVVAWAVDAVLLSVMIAFAATLVSLVVERDSLYAALSILLAAGYFVLSWRTLSGSPGMRLLRLRVSELSWRDALVRWALLVLPFGVAGSARVVVASGAVVGAAYAATFAWYLVLFVTTARSATKQGLHDRLARSRVTVHAR